MDDKSKPGPVNITSHGQTGGITAHTVNSGSPTPVREHARHPRSAKGWLKATTIVAGVVVAVAGAIAAVLKVLPHPKDIEMNNQQQPINITSYNQSGGITAHTVIIANAKPGPRHLDDNAKATIDAFVAQKRPRIFGFEVSGPQESLDFTGEIRAYMQSKGYAIESAIRTYAIMRVPSVSGATLCEPGSDGVALVVVGLP